MTARPDPTHLESDDSGRAELCESFDDDENVYRIRADGRQDDATLTAVGATRMLRRKFAFWQALITVGVGVITGTAAALLTTYALSLLDTSGPLSFIPPWLVLAALVIGMPLVIAAGSWLVASRPTTLAHRMSVS